MGTPDDAVVPSYSTNESFNRLGMSPGSGYAFVDCLLFHVLPRVRGRGGAQRRWGRTSREQRLIPWARPALRVHVLDSFK